MQEEHTILLAQQMLQTMFSPLTILLNVSIPVTAYSVAPTVTWMGYIAVLEQLLFRQVLRTASSGTPQQVEELCWQTGPNYTTQVYPARLPIMHRQEEIVQVQSSSYCDDRNNSCGTHDNICATLWYRNSGSYCKCIGSIDWYAASTGKFTG